MDVSEALVDYLADIKHLAEKSQLLYQQHLTVFAQWASLQGVSLEQVNNRNVQVFLDWLRCSSDNYNSLDLDTREFVRSKALEIHSRLKRTAADIILIGQDLIDVKGSLFIGIVGPSHWRARARGAGA
jgi:hypothetical protein